MAPKVPAWEPDPFRHLYESVADHLALRIGAGEWAPGSRLPPERDLAEEYGVAYMTVRHSTALLRERGLIVTLIGRGNIVARGDG